MKVLILTTNKSTLKWNSLDSKLETIDIALNSGLNADFEPTQIKYAKLVPEVLNGRITHAWFKEFQAPYFKLGYDFVGLHMSDRDRKRFGIQENLRGSNPRLNGEEEQFYFWADAYSKRGEYNQFIETCLHEIKHGYHSQTNTKDTTHEDHDRDGTLLSSMCRLDWGKYQPERMALRDRVRYLMAYLSSLLVTTEEELPLKNELQPRVRRAVDKVLTEMKSYGMEMRMTEGYRSMERQSELYAQGRTKPGNKVTNAKAGQSFHNYGVAADFVFRKQGYDAPELMWTLFGTVGKKHGFEWGGDWTGFVDRPHLEMVLDYKLKDFQDNKINWEDYK